MRYQIDHDFHIHSQLSSCSSDPAQTTEYLLSMAEKYGYANRKAKNNKKRNNNVTINKKGSINSKSANTSYEIKLLGMTADEAIAALDKYLDDAYLAHIPVVRVVHGKGTGVLRNAVQNYLKKHPHVEEYHLGEFGEGDAGVTIVTFK